MSVAMTTTGQALSWEEYERLPEDPRVEYVDGHLVVSPGPTRRHRIIGARLWTALEAATPATHETNLAWSWKPGRDEFIPDVTVYPLDEVAGSDARFTGTPALVVEVLSSNRGDDLVRKVGKYAAAGLPHHWILDPRDRTLEAFVLQDGTYAPAARLDEAAPVGQLDLGIARVTLDLAELLR